MEDTNYHLRMISDAILCGEDASCKTVEVLNSFYQKYEFKMKVLLAAKTDDRCTLMGVHDTEFISN